jgi:hypothetical protein
VGTARKVDMANRPVDTKVTFPGGMEGEGVAGLQAYIKSKQQGDFIENLSRKLLVYALGLSLQLSDEALIDRMKTNLAANGYRFRALIETIVLSPQFRDRRAGTVTAAADGPAAPVPAAANMRKINFEKGAR